MTLTCSMLIAATMATAPAVPVPSVELSPAPITRALEQAAPAIGAPRVAEAWMVDRAERRPAALTAMYGTLVAVQALDVYTTRRALGAGAQEANPLMRRAAGSSGAMLAVKAVSTVGTVFFAERAWKKNRKGAVILMAVINGATAAIAAHNLRNAQR